MDTLDDLLELKRLRDNTGLARLVKAYDVNLVRLKNRVFKSDTPDDEVQRLKWQVRGVEDNHPMKLLENEIRSMESRIEKAHAANTK